ncbi:hypothetical protein TEQG_08039 [Trichophyton equinum CBS 127.97]|uniref:Amine oxidase domain-containing protein n=1 Tax=Trichophyton equinum (strain ATCC MYA-4606 / CBS 127.97) TaxID=559882 RepID=F2Q4N8_TRIEC|nr:hypothetical protein TEQG_08039 [Trichophyton equinum CBS 127.97]
MLEAEIPNQRAGSNSDGSRISVAIVGTGMAGLVTAYLLRNDENQKFDIEVFESQDALSLNAEGETIKSENGRETFHISHPMRVFDDGYYKHMTLMYKHLGIKCDPLKFLFSYSFIPKALPSPETQSDQAQEELAQPKVSFLYSSNNHRLPPLRPGGQGFLSWLWELIYVASSSVEPVKAQTTSREEVEWGHFRSTVELTESIHEHPSSYIITTCPILPIDPSKVVRRSYFTRTLRTPQSRAVVNRIFDKSATPDGQAADKPAGWRNGEGNVFLVGSWCWDGMVLLEGCVVSAMRAAEDFGVKVPWAQS